MRLRALRIRGFRSLRDVDVPIDNLTSLIGRNGSGKSSVLEALTLLFDPAALVENEDFWRAGPQDERAARSEEIAISGTFCELEEAAADAFEPFIHEGLLEVERHFSEPGRGRYLGVRLTVPDFARIRSLPKSQRDEFNALVESGSFEGLQKVTSKEDAFKQMDSWEKANPTQCERTAQEVDFFSGAAGSPGSLSTYVSFIPVAALEAPEEHLDARRTSGAIGRLISEIVKSDSLDEELGRVAQQAAEAADQVLESRSGELATVGTAIEEGLKKFAPGFGLEFGWEPMPSPNRKSPAVRIAIATSEGIVTDLRHQGQGVQRSLMYAVLTAAVDKEAPEGERSVLLAIEEPEAFQHPLSSRALGKTLTALTAQNYQILYTTHSPYFVQPVSIGGLRLVRRTMGSDGHETQIASFSLAEFATVYGDANERDDFTAETIQARLEANLESRILEGLFAKACVLVEGDEDEALIRGASIARGIHLDDLGIAVLQTRGKGTMPLVVGFLHQAGVPCYPIFDLDRDKDESEQHRPAEMAVVKLLRGAAEVLDGNVVSPDMAYWHRNLGALVAEQMGAEYDTFLTEVSEELGYAPTQGRKVAPVLTKVLDRARAAGLGSPMLDAVIDAIQVLAGKET